MTDRIFDKTIDTLGTAMNYRQLNQDLITSNIANAETPEFKALQLDFEKALQDAVDTDGTNTMRTSNPKHFVAGGGGIDINGAQIYEDPDVIPSNDLNTVDVEKEMTRLAANQIMFDASTKLINTKLGLLKYAISEGGKGWWVF